MSEELRLDFLDNERPQLLKSFTETYKSASPKGLESSTITHGRQGRPGPACFGAKPEGEGGGCDLPCRASGVI